MCIALLNSPILSFNWRSDLVVKDRQHPTHFGCTIKQEIEWERFGLAHKQVWMIKMSKRVS